MASMNLHKLWIKYYLDESNPETFMNGAESARKAGYSAKNPKAVSVRAAENMARYKKKIQKFLIDAGYTEDAVKLKIMEGFEAMETKFFQKDGIVVETRQVINWSARVAYLRLAADCMGMIKRRHEISGPGGKPMTVFHAVRDLDKPPIRDITPQNLVEGKDGQA